MIDNLKNLNKKFKKEMKKIIKDYNLQRGVVFKEKTVILKQEEITASKISAIFYSRYFEAGDSSPVLFTNMGVFYSPKEVPLEIMERLDKIEERFNLKMVHLTGCAEPKNEDEMLRLASYLKEPARDYIIRNSSYEELKSKYGEKIADEVWYGCF